MKEDIEQSQESLNLNEALSADPELSNAHMFPNDPAENLSDEKAEQVPSKEKTIKPDVSKEKFSFRKFKVKIPFAKVFKWIVILSVIVFVLVSGIWVYANKAVLFPQQAEMPKRLPITSVNETPEQKLNVISNPYATQSDLREASYAIRQDFKEAMREFSRGLDKIDRIEMQMGVFRGKFNELKTYVMQQKNISNNGVDTSGYNDMLAKLTELEVALSNTASYASQIESLKKMDKERKLLEAMLKNNDWDLRKRMERVEATTGISSTTKPSAPKSNASKNRNTTPYGHPKRRTVKQASPVKQQQEKEVGVSKAVNWKTKHRWKITMISNALTQIQNIDTGKNYRISEGIEIKGCGLVLAIDVPERTITTQHCVI